MTNVRTVRFSSKKYNTDSLRTERRNAWVQGRNPINGNTSSMRKRWVILATDLETGEEIEGVEITNDRDTVTYITKKEALAAIARLSK